MQHQAFATFEVKAIDDEQRVITGIASTPEADRGGDEMDPRGATFTLPMPFRWEHKATVGEVFAADVTAAGITIQARIVKVDEPGTLKDQIDFAWQSIKHKLARGLSIGWLPIEAKRNSKGGLTVAKWTWLETSAVSLPMNMRSTISNIKSVDTGAPKSGTDFACPDPAAEVSALSPRSRREPAMTTSERIKTLQDDRKKTADRMAVLYQPVQDGTDLSAEHRKEFDGLKATLSETDTTISDLLALEQAQIMPKAVAITGTTQDEGTQSRHRFAFDEGRAKEVLPPGIEFTRYFICKAAGRIFGMSPMDVARARYPDTPRIQTMLKAAVAGATTTDSTWAAPLLQDVRTVTSEFLDYLRPRTILGRFGTDGIPPLARVGFYERVQSQTTGGWAGWTGEGVQKPVTKFDFDAFTTTPTKVTAISVMSDELIKYSTPSAEGRVRDALVKIIVERLDRDFIDPDKAAVTNVSPASITNGITGLTPSAGGDADDVRTDIAALMGAFIGTNQDVTNLVWVMSGTSAMQLMLMRNALGNREFPAVTIKGGEFEGFPVIVSQYAAVVGSPTQNIVILMNPSEIFLADEGQVTVDMSNEATIEMSDDPANESGSQVNMYQTNQVALRAERRIFWRRGRASSVAWLDGVAWTASA